MSIYSIKQSKIIAIILILIIGLFLFYSLHELYTAILASVVLYVLFKPMYIYFLEKKIPKGISVTIVIIISFLIIILPFITFVGMIVDKIIYFKENPEPINKFTSTIEEFAGKNFDPSTVKDMINKAGAWVVSLFPSFLSEAAALLLTISMMYFFLYFMLTKYKIFESTLIKYMPFREKNTGYFAKELQNMTFSNTVGQGIISLAQSIFLGIGFLIFGIPDPVFWGLVCFFLSFVPVIGSAGVFVPAGIFEIASGDNFSGFGIMIFGFIVVANVDNLLRLWINKWIGDIHPLITITGIVIGLPLFGILGLVFGPLLISLFILLIKLYEAAYTNANGTIQKERVVNEDEI